LFSKMKLSMFFAAFKENDSQCEQQIPH